jgi:aryl-alcohol dehydrogenase-like predicted oxidoreductase
MQRRDCTTTMHFPQNTFVLVMCWVTRSWSWYIPECTILHAPVNVENSAKSAGTMLCGELLDRSKTFELLSTANDVGIRAWDTAEMYPVPQRAETQGRSEKLLGEWLRTQRRETQHVTTKVAGPGGMEWLRGGPATLDGENITEALHSSLRRLKLDYVDVMLLHWPDRCFLYCTS